MHHNVSSHIGITADELPCSANQNTVFHLYAPFTSNIAKNSAPIVRFANRKMTTTKIERLWCCIVFAWVCIIVVVLFEWQVCVFVRSLHFYAIRLHISIVSPCKYGFINTGTPSCSSFGVCTLSVDCICEHFVSFAPLGWFSRKSNNQSTKTWLFSCHIEQHNYRIYHISKPCTFENVLHILSTGKSVEEKIIVFLSLASVTFQ